jgi:hypothetical protein
MGSASVSVDVSARPGQRAAAGSPPRRWALDVGPDAAAGRLEATPGAVRLQQTREPVWFEGDRLAVFRTGCTVTLVRARYAELVGTELFRRPVLTVGLFPSGAGSLAAIAEGSALPGWPWRERGLASPELRRAAPWVFGGSGALVLATYPIELLATLGFAAAIPAVAMGLDWARQRRSRARDRAVMLEALAQALNPVRTLPEEAAPYRR